MSLTSPFLIRPAVTSDLPAIVRIDAAANPEAPVVKIPWTSVEDFYTSSTDRYAWMLRRPDHQGVVACTPGEEKVVGFLIWKRPAREGEELHEQESKWPKGTNELFFATYLSALHKEFRSGVPMVYIVSHTPFIQRCVVWCS